MKLVACEDMSEVSHEASRWCVERAPTSMFVPAGNTPVPLYRLWEKERPAFLSTCELYQIDDIVSGPARGRFREFFEKELPSYLSRFHWIDRANSTAQAALLGLGLNGHIAFHEPGFGPDFFSGCVRLTPTTCAQLGIADGAWGVTYGGGAFRKCQSIAMLVTGTSKREVLARLLNSDKSLPATSLLSHPDITIFTDRAARM